MTKTKLELSIALSENENTRAVLDGRIAPDAIKLHPTALHPSEMFWRQLKFAEFDVSEMSMSSLTIATSQGADAMGRAAGVHHARVLPPAHPGARRRPASRRRRT